MDSRRDRPITRDSRVPRSIAKVHADDMLTQGFMIVTPPLAAPFWAHLRPWRHYAELDYITASCIDSSCYDAYAR